MALTGKCCEYYFESIFTAKLRQKQILYQKSELGSQEVYQHRAEYVRGSGLVSVFISFSTFEWSSAT